MRVVVQRVKEASVKVNEQLVSKIGKGYVLLVGFHHLDDVKDIQYMAKKIKKLRIFSDDQGQMNLNIDQVQGEILSVSQFTLYGDVKKQNRPGFTEAMPYEKANRFYQQFLDDLSKQGLHVKDGIFGENMQVSLVNDGPVTLLVETKH